MRRLVTGALLALLLSFIPQPRVHAWGSTSHKLIMDRAIALLPQPLRPYFDKYRSVIVERSIDPDTYRTVGFTEEEPRHFLDMDAYGPFPFAMIPHDYNAAVAARGQDFVVKNGTLPWRVQELHTRLIDAFRQLQTAPYARDNVRLLSSVVAHYISDATQPLHATSNYDGQLTGQLGIHARFESELVERYGDRLKLAPAPVVPVTNARDFAFAALTDSYEFVKPILDADRAAVAGRDVYDDAYFNLLFGRTRPILEQRLSAAITDVASLITSAWNEAGRPALPPDAPARAPRKVRKE